MQETRAKDPSLLRCGCPPANSGSCPRLPRHRKGSHTGTTLEPTTERHERQAQSRQDRSFTSPREEKWGRDDLKNGRLEAEDGKLLGRNGLDAGALLCTL